MRRNLRSLLFLSSVLFIFPSRSTFTPLFVRVVRTTASFIVFVPRYPPLLSRRSHSGPRYLFQIFHARIRVYKRALSYFPRSPLFSRSPWTRPRDSPHPLRDISRFPFRMYARCLIRDPFYFVSILSSFVAQSAFLGHLFPFSLSLLLAVRAFLPPYSSNSQPLRYFADGRSLKIRYARFPPITRVNLARSSRAENRKIVGPGKRCSLERESPVKQYSAKFL